MLIRFVYKDGSVRFLKPMEVFFPRDIKGSIDIKELTFKVKALMSDTGKCGLVEVFHGDTHLLTIENEKNMPQCYPNIPEKQRIKERLEQRELIKEIKKNLKRIAIRA